MKIYISSLFVPDQDKALEFYTTTLGFVVKHEIPLGEHKWLTIVGAENPDGPEVSLEPDVHPALKPFKTALMEDGIPATSFMVDDVNAEYERLTKLGVVFTQQPTEMGSMTLATFDDTCGNLIQIVSGAE
ncbi:VOC family protein [Rhodococcoides kyotonense]|uniref:Bleomycin resistance protein n=1 Tax=Rhodococcoides kyotonense TaxID=398843 RepID=A0A177Y8S9_9NOCA|nr:VOC family protein [Rhodococcus kyotonensis]OAK51915.1 bleomycin resistance protein [Rhodococcus kyotonensis]